MVPYRPSIESHATLSLQHSLLLQTKSFELHLAFAIILQHHDRIILQEAIAVIDRQESVGCGENAIEMESTVYGAKFHFHVCNVDAAKRC